MSGLTSVPTVIAACATTVLAAAAIVGLTATAQEYVLGKEHRLEARMERLENGQANLSQKLDQLIQAQAQPNPAHQPTTTTVYTQEQFDAAMRVLIEQIFAEVAKQQMSKK